MKSTTQSTASGFCKIKNLLNLFLKHTSHLMLYTVYAHNWLKTTHVIQCLHYFVLTFQPVCPSSFWQSSRQGDVLLGSWPPSRWDWTGLGIESPSLPDPTPVVCSANTHNTTYSIKPTSSTITSSNITDVFSTSVAMTQNKCWTWWLN